MVFCGALAFQSLILSHRTTVSCAVLHMCMMCSNSRGLLISNRSHKIPVLGNVSMFCLIVIPCSHVLPRDKSMLSSFLTAVKSGLCRFVFPLSSRKGGDGEVLVYILIAIYVCVCVCIIFILNRQLSFLKLHYNFVF